MLRSRRRHVVLLVGLPVFLVVVAFLYQLGMASFEGTPRGFWRSLEWASETLTSTGYGGDHTWTHPVMILFVILVQMASVVLIFLLIPIVLLPVLESQFERKLPREVPSRTGHVVVYRYGPAVEDLLDVLAGARVEAVVVEEDEGTTRRLLEDGRLVVFGRHEDAALVAAGLENARALIANGPDHENATMILGARQIGFKGEILAMVEEPRHRAPTLLAGASAVFTPRHVLAAALAARASERISPRLSGLQHLGPLRVEEVRVQVDSQLVGRTLAQAAIGAETGATVLGQWVGGKLLWPPTADMRLVARGILVVAGGEESLARLARLATPLKRSGPIVVAGFGEVGRKVHELLTDAGETVVVVDRGGGDGVDIEGDVLDPTVLEAARVDQARVFVLAVDSDDATLFGTLVLRDVAPHLPVVARVNQIGNVEKIYQAGADFALSLSQVAGHFLARRLLGQESISIDPTLKVLRTSTPELAGRHPAEARIRERTGCSVVAVMRGDEALVEIDEAFRFAVEDTLYVCGTEEGVRRFVELFPRPREST